MAQQFNGNNNARAKTILNDYAQPHPETEQPLQGARHNGALRFEQKANGEIVLRVYDNIFVQGGGQRPPMREVALNYNERGVLFETVRQAADMKNDFASAQLPINQHGWVRGDGGKSKRTDEPVNMCNLIVSRDEKGRVTLTYQKGDFSFKTVFRMANLAAMRFKKADGTTIEDAGMPSRMSAKTWCSFHEPLLNSMEVAAWKPKGAAANNNNNSGGGNNNYSNNNSNNNNNSGGNGGAGSMNQTTEDFDEEINW